MPDKKAVEKTTAEAAEKNAEKTTKVAAGVTKVAEECLAGNRKWNTGRDRDELLKKAGYDPEAVRAEVYRIRGERLANS